MPPPSNLPALLRQVRLQRGLTIRELIAQFDEPRPYVSQISEWERGLHDPAAGVLEQWVTALGGTLTATFPDLPKPTAYEYGLRVDIVHPRRKEKVGDVISLRPDWPEDEARTAAKVWHGWTLVRRPVYTPPRRSWEVPPDAE